MVETDKHGVVMHVATDDPALTGTWDAAKLAAVRALVRANADLFAIPADAADRIPADGLLVDEAGEALLGELQIQHSATRLDITAMFWVDATPNFDKAAVVQQIAGRRYRETIGYRARRNATAR